MKIYFTCVDGGARSITRSYNLHSGCLLEWKKTETTRLSARISATPALFPHCSPKSILLGSGAEVGNRIKKIDAGSSEVWGRRQPAPDCGHRLRWSGNRSSSDWPDERHEMRLNRRIESRQGDATIIFKVVGYYGDDGLIFPQNKAKFFAIRHRKMDDQETGRRTELAVERTDIIQAEEPLAPNTHRRGRREEIWTGRIDRIGPNIKGVWHHETEARNDSIHEWWAILQKAASIFK